MAPATYAAEPASVKARIVGAHPSEEQPAASRRGWTGLRLVLASLRQSAMSVVRVLVVLLAVVVLLYAFKACHRLDDPPALTPDQMNTAMRLARAAIEAAPPQKRSAPPDEPSLRGFVVSEPVFVTVYGPDAAGRTNPAFGWWAPTESEPSLALAEAITRAGRAAGHKLRSAGRNLRGTAVKVDVAGPARGVWLSDGWYLGLVVDPGRDGLRAAQGQEKKWFLPSWTVERGRKPVRAARKLVWEFDQKKGAPKLARFRTTSFVQPSHGHGAVHPVFRGNVLLQEPSADNVRRALIEAGRFLARSINPDGAYCYEYRPIQDRCAPGYNLLRHAGTTYSLYQIHHQAPEPDLLEAAERATEWLRNQVRTVDGDPSRAYLLEGNKAKLGALGLSLIALVEREKVVGDGRDRELLTKLAAFAISQQREDGYFHSYFEWKPGVQIPKRQSIYYPGEALLGLTRLYGMDPQPRYLQAALEGAEFLVKKRWRWAGVELYVPPDAWLAQALTELDAIAPADWLRDYAYKIVNVTEMGMLRADEGAPPDLVGGPSNGLGLPRVTPAGSRNEGITAVWRLAKRRGETEAIARFRALSLRSARFQLNQQYRPENSYFLPNPARARGGLRGTPVDGEVRIDYVQHNASALLGVLEMLREDVP